MPDYEPNYNDETIDESDEDVVYYDNETPVRYPDDFYGWDLER